QNEQTGRQREEEIEMIGEEALHGRTSLFGGAIESFGGLVACHALFLGWHALRYSEGRGEFAGTARPSEYLRPCHSPSSRLASLLHQVPGCGGRRGPVVRVLARGTRSPVRFALAA